MKSKLQEEKFTLRAEQINLLNAKVYYKCADFYLTMEDVFEEQEEMWISAENTIETLKEARDYTEETIELVEKYLEDTYDSLRRSSEYIHQLEKYNPGLTKDLVSILKYGRK